MQFLNRAAVSWFSVMATKLFLAVSLLTCSRAIPANASVIKGITIPNEINTTWIGAQLNEITLSLETMVCPSEILQSNQSCSGQQEQIYWEPSALCPCLAEPPTSLSKLGGCRVVTLLHCGSGYAAALVWETPSKRPWQSHTVALAWAMILFLGVVFFIPSLSLLPVTCCQNCAVAVCEDFFFPFFPSLSLANKLLTLC